MRVQKKNEIIDNSLCSLLHRIVLQTLWIFWDLLHFCPSHWERLESVEIKVGWKLKTSYVLVLLTHLCIPLEIFFHYSICISSGLWSSWEHVISIHCGVPAIVAWMPFRTHFLNQRYAKRMYLYCSCVFVLHLKSYKLFDMNRFRIMKQFGICNSHSLWSSSYCCTDAILHSFFESTICQGYVLTLLMFLCIALETIFIIWYE
jgi:hypothetical protein